MFASQTFGNYFYSTSEKIPDGLEARNTLNQF